MQVNSAWMNYNLRGRGREQNHALVRQLFQSTECWQTCFHQHLAPLSVGQHARSASLYSGEWWKTRGTMVMLCHIGILRKIHLHYLQVWNTSFTYCQACAWASEPWSPSVQSDFRSTSFLLLVACASSMLSVAKPPSAHGPKLRPGRQWRRN